MEEFLNNHGKGCLISSIVAAVVVLTLIFVPANFIRHADSGSVGLLIDYGTLTGGQPSVRIVPTNQYVWVNSFGGQAFVEYSTQQQSLVMTANQTEGEVNGDDSIRCQDTNGITVRLDVTVQWQVNAQNAQALYLKVRDMALAGNFNNDVTSRIVPPIVRGAIATACST